MYKTLKNLRLETLTPGCVTKLWFHIVEDGLGMPVNLPLLIARGHKPGPTLGITSAVHGNELNGIPVIQRLFANLDISQLSGTIIGVPVVNIPSFRAEQRRFTDGVDLNHIMPGIPDGTTSQVYVHRFIEEIVAQFDYLLDIHTASFGRINSHYIRADMAQEAVRNLALIQNADIIVHNPPSDGTLRGSADALGIPALTLELGNPHTFQKKLIKTGVVGVHNVLAHLDMLPIEIIEAENPTVICERSYWLYTDAGGLMTSDVDITDRVEKGQRIASIRDVFGDLLKTYTAPENGIVIGKSINPINETGGRILHLGIPRKEK